MSNCFPKNSEIRKGLEQRKLELEQELAICRRKIDELGDMPASERTPSHAEGYGADVPAARQSKNSGMQALPQIVEALDALVDGLVIFDADERMVLCNTKYKELQPAIQDMMVPGICSHSPVNSPSPPSWWMSTNSFTACDH